MTASHPEPALSAGWYRAINSAAAKLALAAGVAPATVRSVCGFRRVEIKLTEQAVARQILTLTKSAMLVGVELPPRLTETGNDPQHFLSRRFSDDLSDDLLQICSYARTSELLATYHHHIQQFNKELDFIMADFEQYKIQWRDHWALYQHQHDQIRALTAPIVNRAATGPMSVRRNHLQNFSGQKFAHVIAALDHAIRQRGHRQHEHDPAQQAHLDDNAEIPAAPCPKSFLPLQDRSRLS
jgi:hypothetical protein